MAIGQVGCGVNLLCCSLNPSRSTARHAGSWAVGEAASVSLTEEAPHSVDRLHALNPISIPAQALQRFASLLFIRHGC